MFVTRLALTTLLSLAPLIPTAALAQTTASTTPVPAKPTQPRQDWANLARYQPENAALPAPSPGKQRVVFLGDSITDFWGRSPDKGTFFPGQPFVNRGISGQTTPQMLVRFQQDVVHLHPAAVVILAGTNDIAGNTGASTPEMIEDNLASMTEIAEANGIKVILASILPAARYPWKPEVQPVAEIRELNRWMRTFCTSHHAVYLDFYSSMADKEGAMLPGYASDGVHPLAKGYAVMSTLASAAIQKALQP